jgi:hypothetical protein
VASDAVYGLIGAVAGSALTILGQSVQSIRQTKRERNSARKACLDRLEKIKIAVSNSNRDVPTANTPPLTPINFEKTANDEVHYLGGDIDRLFGALAVSQRRRWSLHRRSHKARSDLATLDGLRRILLTHNLDELDRLQADLGRAIGLTTGTPRGQAEM